MKVKQPLSYPLFLVPLLDSNVPLTLNDSPAIGLSVTGEIVRLLVNGRKFGSIR